jgi:N-methylhydantoinase B
MTKPLRTSAAAEVDPITVEVISSAFASIVEEMGELLIRSSHSTNIKERRDCSTALLDADGELLCQAEHIPMHLGSFLGVVPNILKRHPLEGIAPGDVFIANDPYEGGGTHLPDILLAEPVFFDGALIAWVVNTGHHADFVDRGHAHIFQEGLRIPPVRLYRKGVLQEEMLDLILLNCQAPEERLKDLRAQRGVGRLGVERMTGLCERYGAGVVKAAGLALMDYAERRMRLAISKLPQGTYRFADRFDCTEIPEELELKLELVVGQDTLDLVFESPPQVRASINVPREALLASVYFAVKAALDPTIPPNAGLARPLSVAANEGGVLNCSRPAAVNGRLQPCQRVVDLVFGALAQAVPDQITAAGAGACPSVTFVGAGPGPADSWIYLEAIGGGAGARREKDGLDGVHVSMTNSSNLPVEALETEYPLTVLSYALIEGSGGEGRRRGGRGLLRSYRVEADCRVRIGGSRLRSRPWGLAGGLPGASGAVRLGPGVPPFAGAGGVLRAGQVVEIESPGGGGFGPPEAREPELRLRDRADWGSR